MDPGLLLAVGVFILLLLLTGVFHARSRRNADEYFIAGKSKRFLTVFSSLTATVIGGSATIGLCGLAAADGFRAAVWLWGGVAGLLVAGYLVASPVVREKVYTVPEYLRRHYSPGVARVAALVIVCSWLGVIAAQLLAAGQVMRQILPLPLPWAVLLMALVLGTYVWLGGQQSVMKTDFMQFCLLLAGFILLLTYVGSQIGLPQSTRIVGRHWAEFLLSAESFSWETFSLFLVIGVTFLSGPDIFSRFLCSSEPQSARLAAWASAGVLLPFSVVVVALGVLGHILQPLLAGDELLPGLATAVIPHSLWQGMILAGILAAVLSSADTCVMTAATILVMETRPRPADERLAYVPGMTLAIPAVIAGAVIVALLFPSILDVLLSGYLFYTAAVSPILLPPLLGHGRNLDGRLAAVLLAGGVMVSVVSVLLATTLPVAGWFLAALAVGFRPRRTRNAAGFY
jgi:SSS family solute:Na+ symporter